ncbi:MAG: Ig-like domain-containing protein [bacterium]|nr:Ig-like domain-containing protein [bacterium]
MSKMRFLAMIIGALALILAGVGVQNVYAVTTDLLISEYIEGSSFNKSIEIYNGTGVAVDLGVGQYRLELYSNGSGTVSQFVALTGTLADGDVFVVSHASANVAILGVTDLTSSTVINFNGDDGVVLRKGGAGGTVVDSIGQIGTDPGTEWAGGGLSTLNRTLVRNATICTGDIVINDVFDPSTEWTGFAQDNSSNLGAHTASCGGADTAPTVSSTTPTNTATNVAVTSNITINFSEAVDVTAGGVTLDCDTFTSTPTLPATNTTSLILDPTSDLPTGTLCTVTVVAANVTDTDVNDPPNAMVADYVFSFTTETPAVPGANRIRDIQGIAHISPQHNIAQTNVPGIVTALVADGFWMQDPDLSGDATGNDSSEGIFVFTGNPVPAVATIGNAVLVSGVVRERFGLTQIGGTNAGTLPPNSTPNTTSPGATAVTVSSWTCTGDCSVDTVLVGDGNATAQTACSITAPYIRQRPFTSIEDDGFATFNTAVSGMDFWESLEGMRVCMHNLAVTSLVSNFNEFWIVPDNGASATLFNSRGGLTISAGDLNPEGIYADDTLFNGLGGQPAGGYPADADIEVGARIAGGVTGIIGYGFDNYEFLINQPITLTPTTNAKEITALVATAPYDFTVATYNVENLGGNASAAAFAARADQICNHLLAPDVVMLQEMQDDNGATNNGVVTAGVTATNLINAIFTDCNVTYAFSQIDPAPGNVDGGAPGGNIRQVFLYRIDRNVNLATGATGDFDDATTVTCTAGSPVLNYTLGRIDPTNSAFNSSRKPLVGQFSFNGANIFLINLHMNSKGGDGALWGFTQPPVLSSEVQRLQQVVVIQAFVQEILTCDPNANIIISGDYNDFQFSTPVTNLVSTTPPMTVMNTTLPAAERYSYNFGGNAQALDHISLSANLFNNTAPVYDTVHINSEFSDQVSDHDPSIIRIQIPNTLTENSSAQTTALTSTNPLAPVILTATVSFLDVTFSADVANGNPANPDHAENPANYIVLAEGSVAGFQTTGATTCQNPVNAGDTQIIPATVVYNTGTRATTLTFTTALPQGKYSLIVCGSTSITSTFGLPVNGGVDVQYFFDIVINGGGTNTGGNGTGGTGTGTTTTGTTLTQQEILDSVVALPATGETPFWADTLRTVMMVGGIMLITFGAGFVVIRRRATR